MTLIRFGAAVVLAALPLVVTSAPGAIGATGPASGLTINTLAGGDGGPAPGTTVAVQTFSVSSSGSSVYVGGTGVVWELSESSDVLTPVAGVGADVAGRTDSGIPALQAGIPSGSASWVGSDASGNILVPGNGQVRVVARHTGVYFGQSMTAGHIYSVAGGGTSTANGIPALQAKIAPVRSTVDGAGNLVITTPPYVRVVAASSGTFYGQQMKAGDIYTVFTGDALSKMTSAVVDQSGNLVIADPGDGALYVRAEKTGSFYGQSMVAGNLYTLSSITLNGGTLALDGAGNVVFSNAPGAGDLVVQVVAARSGTYYGQIMTAGQVYTIAGGGSSTADGVPALQAAVSPYGLAVDQSGNLLISDDRDVRVVPIATGTLFGKSVTAGDIYTVAGNESASYQSGDGGSALAAELGDSYMTTFDGSLAYPQETAVDSAGNVIIADGAVRVVAAQTGEFYGMAMTKGDVYSIGSNLLPAVTGVALDPAGNVVVTDQEGNESIAVIAARSGTYYGQRMFAGHGYPVCSSCGGSSSMAVDRYGNFVYPVYNLSSAPYYSNIYVYAVKSGNYYGQQMTAGKTYIVAGLRGQSNTPCQPPSGVPAVGNCLWGPMEVRTDSAGNLVLTDNGIVQVVAASAGTFYGRKMQAHYVYTIPGASGNVATADAAGNLIFAGNEVRVLAGKTGVFYGISMTAGKIYRIAGTGTAGFSGDGGLAIHARLSNAAGVTVTNTGGIVLSDDDRVRLIS